MVLSLLLRFYHRPVSEPRAVATGSFSILSSSNRHLSLKNSNKCFVRHWLIRIDNDRGRVNDVKLQMENDPVATARGSVTRSNTISARRSAGIHAGGTQASQPAFLWP